MSESTRRIAELQRELAGNPGSRQFYQLGELLRREGKAPEAAETLRSGLAHHPRYVAAWVALGRACLALGQPSEAVHTLEQAIALDPQNPVAWRLLGEGHLALGERPEALEAMKHCLQLVPGDEVLQSAVDAIAAEMAAPAPPAEPHEAAPTAATVSEPEEVFAAAEEAEEAVPAPEPPPAPEPVPDGLVWEPEAAPRAPEPTLPSESQAPALPTVPESAPPVGDESAEVVFGETPASVEAPAEPPLPEAPAATPAVEAPSPQATGEAELFTAPETEEGPALLKRVLQASASDAAAGELPLQPPASLTLARLYVQQEALGDSVRILERLLEREPGNIEARDLLALVRDIMEPLPAAPPKLSPRERKIAALQRWLASLTLDRERATP